MRQQKLAGRTILLTTATNIQYAKQISDYLQLFDEVIASNAKMNMSGNNKLKYLLKAYGNKGFDYAGNAKVDLNIWPYAHDAILVNPEPGVVKAAQHTACIAKIFEDRKNIFKTYLKAMRLQQWLKNILIFVPLILAHEIEEQHLVFQAILAFFAFGLCASSVYLLNDLFDLTADREHSNKSKRPLAAGDISIIKCTFLIPVLLIPAYVIAYQLPLEFIIILTAYWLITFAYSLRLKQIALLDVLVLACLYTIRIIAGAAAVSLVPSFWLLAFSMFLFLSLALIKRYSELTVKQQNNKNNVAGRGYCIIDQETLAQLGTSSGYLAVLVLALYINSDQVKNLYSYPEIIWFLCPIQLYWIGRIWLLARRNKINEDPVLFAIQDSQSRWLGLVSMFILFIAT